MSVNRMCSNEDPGGYREKLWNFFKEHKGAKWQNGGINQQSKIDHPRFWEYAMMLEYARPCKKEDKILDIGGTGSLLSWYLASKGHEVWTVEPSKECHKNFEKTKGCFYNSKNITNLCAKLEHIAEMGPFFDRIYSVCVIEHIAEHARKGRWNDYWKNYKMEKHVREAEESFVRASAHLLNPGGILAMTYSYKKQPENSGGGSYFKCAYFRNEEDVKKRIVEISGLELLDDEINTKLVPRARAIGSLFLTKPWYKNGKKVKSLGQMRFSSKPLPSESWED